MAAPMNRHRYGGKMLRGRTAPQSIPFPSFFFLLTSFFFLLSQRRWSSGGGERERMTKNNEERERERKGKWRKIGGKSKIVVSRDMRERRRLYLVQRKWMVRWRQFDSLFCVVFEAICNQCVCLSLTVIGEE